MDILIRCATGDLIPPQESDIRIIMTFLEAGRKFDNFKFLTTVRNLISAGF